ncbi:hypothetical protein OIU84_024729 [Salix udensis]|uniref:Uncharacterized protein n=1 Tax=Salix udensis TaxID=889485 RepID=A0AAD6KHW5_9ROSI|nr:hypothetical protein OIU84_024729 [Salix udensis]
MIFNFNLFICLFTLVPLSINTPSLTHRGTGSFFRQFFL